MREDTTRGGVIWADTLLLAGFGASSWHLLSCCGWSGMGGTWVALVALLPFLCCYLPARGKAMLWVQLLTLPLLLWLVLNNLYAVLHCGESELALGWGITQTVLGIGTAGVHLLARAVVIILQRRGRD